MAFDPANHDFPEEHDWVLPQGSDWSFKFILTDDSDDPEDLTGWTARAMFRRKREDSSPVLSRISPTNITMGDAAGSVELIFADTDTDGIRKFNEDGELELFYDVELISPGGLVTRVLEGTCTLTREVTRS